MIFRVTLWSSLEPVIIVETIKQFPERPGSKYFVKAVRIIIYFLSDLRKIRSIWFIDTSGNKAFVSWLEVQVIPWLLHQLAIGRKARSHVYFIGTFVFAEPHVAIDAEGKFLCVKSFQFGVKLYDFLKHSFHDAFKFLFGLQVTGPVFFKPLPVIVARDIPEKF